MAEYSGIEVAQNVKHSEKPKKKVVGEKFSRQCLNYATCERKLSGECPYWHPMDDCHKFPKCKLAAQLCPLAHPFCNYSAYCCCDEPKLDQYNHRTKLSSSLNAEAAVFYNLPDNCLQSALFHSISTSVGPVRYIHINDKKSFAVVVFDTCESVTKLPTQLEIQPGVTVFCEPSGNFDKIYGDGLLEILKPIKVKKPVDYVTYLPIGYHKLLTGVTGRSVAQELAKSCNCQLQMHWEKQESGGKFKLIMTTLERPTVAKDLHNSLKNLLHIETISLVNGKKISPPKDKAEKFMAQLKKDCGADVFAYRMVTADSVNIQTFSDLKDDILTKVKKFIDESVEECKSDDTAQTNSARSSTPQTSSTTNAPLPRLSGFISASTTSPLGGGFSTVATSQLVNPPPVVRLKEEEKPIESPLVSDPVMATFVLLHWNKLDWWHEFQRKYRVISGKDSTLVQGSKTEIGEAQQSVKHHLKTVVREEVDIDYSASKSITDEQLRHIEIKTTTIVRSGRRKRSPVEPATTVELIVPTSIIIDGDSSASVPTPILPAPSAVNVTRSFFERLFGANPVSSRTPVVINSNPVITPATKVITIGSVKLEVVSGEIQLESTDVIVCTTSRQLCLTSQVAKAIEAETIRKGWQSGELSRQMLAAKYSLSTPHWILPVSRMSFSAVGFHISSGAHWSSDVLKLLQDCDGRKYRSLSMPAIGTGVAGNSLDSMVDQLWLCLTQFAASVPSNLTRIRLVLYQSAQVDDVWQRILVIRQNPPRQIVSSPSSAVERHLRTFDIWGTIGNIKEAKRQLLEMSNKGAEVKVKSVSYPELIGMSTYDVDELKALAYSLQLSLTLERENLTVRGPQDNTEKFVSQSLPQFLLQKTKENGGRILHSAQPISHQLPSNWTSNQANCKDFRRVILSPNSTEYRQIATHVATTSRSGTVIITMIERIENPTRYLQYALQKDSVAVKLRQSQYQVERNLFHGTSESSVDGICKEGLNRSLSGVNGTAYGEGCYFSSQFDYSVQFCNRGKKMFYCAVITGRYQINAERKKLKVLDLIPGTNERYDSAVNQHPNPTIFVTYHDSSAYPSHLITIA